MKKVLTIIIIIVVVLALVVGGYFLALNMAKTSALKTVDEMFGAIKSGDQNKLKEYIDLGDTFESGESAEEKETSERMAKIMLENVNYTASAEKVGFNKATIKVSVSNKDFKEILSNYISKVFSMAFSTTFSDTTEEEMNEELIKYFEEQCNSDSVETKTNDVTLNLEKKDGKWKVSYDNQELVNAIIPGYKDIADSLNNIEE